MSYEPTGFPKSSGRKRAAIPWLTLTDKERAELERRALARSEARRRGEFKEPTKG